MDTKKIEKFVKDFALPILMAVSGLILLLNPDGAVVLVTKLIGWGLVIGGAAKLVVPAVNKEPIYSGDWFVGGVLILVGVIFLAKPLILSDLAGQAVAVLLALLGIDRLRNGFDLRTGLYFAGALVLIVMPRTLTNTLLAVVGVVLLITGIVQILGKVYAQKRLEEAQDPNIIDADI